MPRTIPPKKPLIGIHPAINCTFCTNKSRGIDIKDSSLFFTAECPGFKLSKYIYCREHDHRVDWKICAWRYYNNVHFCCKNCHIGEGMVDIAHSLEHIIPEERKKVSNV